MQCKSLSKILNGLIKINRSRYFPPDCIFISTRSRHISAKQAIEKQPFRYICMKMQKCCVMTTVPFVTVCDSKGEDFIMLFITCVQSLCIVLQ